MTREEAARPKNSARRAAAPGARVFNAAPRDPMGSPIWVLLLLLTSLDWSISLDNGAARLPPLGCAFRCSALPPRLTPTEWLCHWLLQSLSLLTD